jgi:hypothetical protein
MQLERATGDLDRARPCDRPRWSQVLRVRDRLAAELYVLELRGRRVGDALERLLDFYIASGGTSHKFWHTAPLDKVKSLIADLIEIDDTSATELDFVDHGEATAFEVVTGEGECAA